MSKTVRWIIATFERPLNSLLGRIRQFEETLGPEDDWVEDDRRLLFEAFNGVLGYSTVYDIDDTDYVTTAQVDPDRFEEILYEHGYRRNLVSGRKRRDTAGGKQSLVDSDERLPSSSSKSTKQYAKSSWATYYGPDDDYQHHVWIFESPNGGTDIYAHAEDNVTDSAAHLHVRDDEDDIRGMIRGEPRGLYDILTDENIEYGKREL